MIGVEGVPVEDGEEALALMLHHLELAAAYYEATPAVVPHERYAKLFSARPIWEWLVAMDRLYPA